MFEHDHVSFLSPPKNWIRLVDDLFVHRRKIIFDCAELTKLPEYENECHFERTSTFRNILGKMLVYIHVDSTLTVI